MVLDLEKVTDYIKSTGLVQFRGNRGLSYHQFNVGEIGHNQVFLFYNVEQDRGAIITALELRKKLIQEKIPILDQPTLPELYRKLSRKKIELQELEAEVVEACLKDNANTK